MRVNPNYLQNTVALLEQTLQDQTTALNQLSTQRRVNQASDDPAAEAAMITETHIAAQNDQYISNSDTVVQSMQSADSTITSVITTLQRAVVLATEGANGTMNQTDLNAIANEVSGIKDEVLSLANTTFAGRYLFGGTDNSTAPYVEDSSTGTITYQGNTQQNSVQIGTSLTVNANLAGSSIFSSSSNNVFTALQNLITAAQSGSSSAIAAAGTDVSNALSTVNEAQVFYGNTINQIQNNETYLNQEKINIASYQNTLVSIDTATAATNVSQAEYARNATVAAAAKMTQVSLLDYLK